MTTPAMPASVERTRSRLAILRKIFSFPFLLGGILVAAGLIVARLTLVDSDTLLHIAVGRDILATGTWPTADSYSFTAYGNECIAFEWLGQVGLALVARLGGLSALILLLVSLSATLLLLLYYYAYLRSGNAKAAFIACVMVLPLAGTFFSLRPQTLGCIFLLITLISLERFRQGRQNTLWILPFVFLLWVNTHATFLFGLLALGLYWLSGLAGFRLGGILAERWTANQRRHLAWVSLLSVLALPLTPYGTRLAATPLDVMLHAPVGVAYIDEYQPIGTYAPLLKLFLGLLLPFLLAQVVFRPTYRLEEMGLLVLTMYLACVHTRFVILFVLVFAPILAALLARWVRAYKAAQDHYALNAALLLLIGAGLVKFFPSRQELAKDMASKFPQGAVEYLRQRPLAGPVLNQDGWGDYLIWTLGPAHKVFIDSRTLLYEESGAYADYTHIMLVEPETAFLLGKYGIEVCLIGRNERLATFLEASPDWERSYEDGLSTLFLRKSR